MNDTPSPVARSAPQQPPPLHPPPTGSAHRSTAIWKGALLVLLSITVYLPSLAPERLWDDNELVFNNAHMRRPGGLTQLWTSGELLDYYPLTWTSFWVEWRLWGENPLGYRATNLALHAAASLLLWRVLLRLGVPAAWFGAALFAVHPVCVASVAWISQRKNTLSMVFFLLSALAWLRASTAALAAIAEPPRRDRAATRGRAAALSEPAAHPAAAGWGWWILSVAAYAAAMLSKVSVVMLPAVLLAIRLVQRGRITGRDCAAIAPFVVIGVILAAVGVHYQQVNAIGTEIVRPEGLLSRVASVGWVVWFYFRTALLPTDLAMVYPRWDVNPAELTHWLPLAALVAAVFLQWRARRTPAGAAALHATGYVVLILAPVLGLASMAYSRISLVSDHLQHLAIPGVTALAAWGLGMALRGAAAARSAALVAATGILLLFGGLTWQRASLFGNQEQLWVDNVRRHPQAWMAHQNLGAVRLIAGRLDEAEPHIRKAIELRPQFGAAHANMGVLLARQGRIADAKAALSEALRLNPRHAAAHRAMGELARSEDRHADAAESFARLVEFAPHDTSAYNALGASLVAAGRAAEAIHVLRKAVSQDATAATIRFNLGYALELSERLDDAIREYREAVRLSPQDHASWHRLAVLLATRSGTTETDVAEALACSTRAVEHGGANEAEILYDHSCLLAMARRDAEARSFAERAYRVARQRGDAGQLARIEAEIPGIREAVSSPDAAAGSTQPADFGAPATQPADAGPPTTQPVDPGKSTPP
ncbi:MAG: tetratricopeptide repeat protein [Phycisphaerales bacterium]|nr:tetratricopeptide repeat protein [Phycisphaerales bacterium]